jgi:hypothetical protein
VLVVCGRELTFDEEVADVGGQFKRVAVGYDYVGDFAGFERADLLGQAEDLCGVERDGFQGFVVG